jgi:hypothetical protein
MARNKFTKEQVIDSFWSKVEKTDSCWLWQGGKTDKGYGQFHTTKSEVVYNTTLAHRFSYWLANGDFDKYLYVCHTCDNPSCVNPNHLFLGTNADNMNDMYSKGRGNVEQKTVRGEEHGRAKLTWEQVREIRQKHSEGGISQRELGRQYGVDNKAIQAIIQNRTWKE